MNELTPEERERTPAYIVTCPVYNGMIGAIVDCPDHRAETSRFCARHISLGYSLERRTVGEVRQIDWCTCKTKKVTP